MAHQYYLSLQGNKQGKIKGQAVPHPGEQGSPFAGLNSFSFATVSPRDAASGLPTGKRMHKPYTVFVEAGAFSQQLQQAFRTGEVLSEVNIHSQPEQIVPEIQLTNATISKFQQTTIPLRAGQSSGKPLYSVDFVFEGLKSFGRP